MDQIIKEKWVAALRSGEYEQGTGALHRYDNGDGNDTFCCLGVLCDLAVQEGVVVRGRGTQGRYEYGSTGERNYLPDEVQKWAGVARTPGVPVTDGRTQSLANKNDDGADFTEIADLIEKYL